MDKEDTVPVLRESLSEEDSLGNKGDSDLVLAGGAELASEHAVREAREDGPERHVPDETKSESPLNPKLIFSVIAC